MGPLHAHRGFTLIELLVVAGIIIVITGVIFAGQRNFSNTVVLASTAYDVALTVHDAETYGLGTRAQAGITNAGYGLDFNSGATRSYILFTDSYPAAGVNPVCHPVPKINGASLSTEPNAYPGDCAYTSNDALVSTYQLGNGVSIANFCAETGSTWSCANGTSPTIGQLDIIFTGPNATPYISTGGAYNPSAPPSNACLELVSGSGVRFITFALDGQIVANAASCP